MTPASQSLDASIRADLLAAARMTGVADGHLLVDGMPIGPTLTSRAVHAELLPDLAAALYSRWFAGWWPPASIAQPTGERPEIMAKVRAAHSATERFETGWMAGAIGHLGAVVAIREGEELHLYPPDYVNLTRLAAPVRVGDSLAVTKRRDVAEPQDGWWLTWGASGPAPTAPMLRVYWNSGAEGVVALVRAITTVLEDLDLPYTMKCPADTALFGRTDAVVLYLAPDVWSAAKAGLRGAYERTAAHIRPAVPPLTLRLAQGVALAEDPSDGSSFGQSRAWAVAEGVLEILAAGLAGTEDIITTLAARLDAHGISPVRPYMRNDSPPDAMSGW
jgi:hypothetical protein